MHIMQTFRTITLTLTILNHHIFGKDIKLLSTHFAFLSSFLLPLKITDS